MRDGYVRTDWIERRIEAACCAAPVVCIVMYARIVMYAHDVTYERIPSTPFGAAGTAGDAAGSPPCGAPWSGPLARALQ